MPVHLVSSIDVKDFGGSTIRIGDLNGDGGPDILVVQNHPSNRRITCLTAVTVDGRVLWQVGQPSLRHGEIYSDLPVQIHDWDGDGQNEVLYIEQARYAELHPGTGVAIERALRYEGDATLVILDARTGQRKGTLPLPAPADDCFLFADLTGSGQRRDLVVKDRYWNMWGVAHDGKVLWHWQGSTGHYPAIGDIDGDGRDEVFVGYALIDHDGRVIYSHDPGSSHQDAADMIRLRDGSWRLLYGNGGLRCLDVSGKLLWSHPLPEAQHVSFGRYRADSEVQCLAINRGDRTFVNSPATAYLYDIDGREIWSVPQPRGSWCTASVNLNWMGDGLDCALLYHRATIIPNRAALPGEPLYSRVPGTPDVVIDGRGQVLDEFEMKYTPDRTEKDRENSLYALPADLWGDGRDEVIISGPRALCVFANARPLQAATLYNETYYPGR
ncbi:MAG: hypothetical protein NTW19_08825 [Planctomycetota bacterium]|nr:hypothetical protein [Planctomycetota bacterium]